MYISTYMVYVTCKWHWLLVLSYDSICLWDFTIPELFGERFLFKSFRADHPSAQEVMRIPAVLFKENVTTKQKEPKRTYFFHSKLFIFLKHKATLHVEKSSWTKKYKYNQTQVFHIYCLWFLMFSKDNQQCGIISYL